MLQYEAGLREKNQVTVPDPVAKQLGAKPGDRLVFEVDEQHPGQARLRVLRRSYAGILVGVYGTPEEAAAYLQEERASWGEDE